MPLGVGFDVSKASVIPNLFFSASCVQTKCKLSATAYCHAWLSAAMLLAMRTMVSPSETINYSKLFLL